MTPRNCTLPEMKSRDKVSVFEFPEVQAELEEGR